MKNIAILASGNGTNCDNIIRYFHNDSNIRVAMVLTNNPKAKVIEKARTQGVKVYIMTKKEFNDKEQLLPILAENSIELIVLAGFLLFLPYGKLTVFLCLFLFTALGFTFQLTLLMLEFQRLLCLCANAFILQLTLNFALHSFGIEFSLYGYFSLDWGTEFQLMPILQQKLIDLIVFRL